MKSFLRVVGILIAILAMVGFGACGVFGLFMGISNPNDSLLKGVALYGLGGLAIAFVLAGFIYRALKRPAAPPPPPSEQ